MFSFSQNSLEKNFRRKYLRICIHLFLLKNLVYYRYYYISRCDGLFIRENLIAPTWHRHFQQVWIASFAVVSIEPLQFALMQNQDQPWATKRMGRVKSIPLLLDMNERFEDQPPIQRSKNSSKTLCEPDIIHEFSCTGLPVYPERNARGFIGGRFVTMDSLVIEI